MAVLSLLVVELFVVAIFLWERLKSLFVHCPLYVLWKVKSYSVVYILFLQTTVGQLYSASIASLIDPTEALF